MSAVSDSTSNNLTEKQIRLITITVMLVAIIEVLDMTIVNVALPPMMGSLGANTEQITWVLTSYIVSAAIFMPLTGFLVSRLGQKRLLLLNIAGFLITSMCCGLATNLLLMVIFRTLQGIFGAALVPLSQSILFDTYPKEQHGKAMAIWGVGVMVAPILGPTLGGYITEHLNWRWVFFINLPVCIIAFYLAIKCIKETVRQHINTDIVGLILLTLAIGGLQIFLDRGNSEGWFTDKSIQLLFVTWVLSIIVFCIYEWRHSQPIIKIRLFADRNFTLGMIVMTIFCLAALGLISLQPILLENFMGYPVEKTGWLMAPRGLASAFAMMLVSQWINRYDAKIFIILGCVLCAASCYLMTMFTLQTPTRWIINTGILQGLGMGMIFVTTSALTFITIDDKDNADGTGLFSFARSMGTSIGISVTTTLISREQQINWHFLSENINLFSRNLHSWLAQQGLTMKQPHALAQISNEIAKQSGMIAFIDSYWLMMFCFLALIPLALLMKQKTN